MHVGQNFSAPPLAWCGRARLRFLANTRGDCRLANCRRSLATSFASLASAAPVQIIPMACTGHRNDLQQPWSGGAALPNHQWGG
eukprot:CAMPEP_0173384402 /NCGR_PEP_ID=MMETSP1356-20130122/6979_1 /TAXON_ID=77927 ORGANISM="Hemiselmis virescens, Strain PCC157" /NCGR_SAMPLE_ID=MMETSP1356 /ASSEMBLY_ACC=CAM_ASM_000847 /LENGTH=83 /DNA_ID=CAMNT_0014339739 /DNA_START=709 /DNA_END=960 /DNA_ORIENTATION=-